MSHYFQSAMKLKANDRALHQDLYDVNRAFRKLQEKDSDLLDEQKNGLLTSSYEEAEAEKERMMRLRKKRKRSPQDDDDDDDEHSRRGISSSPSSSSITTEQHLLNRNSSLRKLPTLHEVAVAKKIAGGIFSSFRKKHPEKNKNSPVASQPETKNETTTRKRKSPSPAPTTTEQQNGNNNKTLVIEGFGEIFTEEILPSKKSLSNNNNYQNRSPTIPLTNTTEGDDFESDEDESVERRILLNDLDDFSSNSNNNNNETPSSRHSSSQQTKSRKSNSPETPTPTTTSSSDECYQLFERVRNVIHDSRESSEKKINSEELVQDQNNFTENKFTHVGEGITLNISKAISAESQAVLDCGRYPSLWSEYLKTRGGTGGVGGKSKKHRSSSSSSLFFTKHQQHGNVATATNKNLSSSSKQMSYQQHQEMMAEKLEQTRDDAKKHLYQMVHDGQVATRETINHRLMMKKLEEQAKFVEYEESKYRTDY